MPERRYERFLRHMMSRCLGVPVEHVDDGSSNGMYDAEVRYPDGRIGAVEFTTLGKRAALEMESFPTTMPLPSTSHWWTLRYTNNGVRWKDIEKHVPMLVMLLDERNMRDADDLRDDLRGTDVWEWYQRNGLSLSHFGTAVDEGRVDVLPRGGGGVVDSEYFSLNPWVEGMQSEAWWSENVSKLARSNLSELHLALRLHDSEVPFGILAALMDGSPIPVGHPAGMAPLTDLWLTIAYKTNVAHWNHELGWTVHDYATPEESTATSERNHTAMKGMIDAAERALRATN
jgi:hypothetical protein